MIAIFCVLPLLAACTGSNGNGRHAESAPPAIVSRPAPAGSAVAAARRVVIRFGERLKSVDTLAPRDLVRRAMRRNYGDLVTGELLRDWLANPKSAPGKTVSSPWPQSIEIERIRCSTAGHCEASGYVRYVTSVEMTHGGAFWKRSITLDLLREQSGWRISRVKEQPRRALKHPRENSGRTTGRSLEPGGTPDLAGFA
ncbi:MAG: hypothetical protein ACRESR_01880 [Gammaproteobacteria bacterium]